MSRFLSFVSRERRATAAALLWILLLGQGIVYLPVRAQESANAPQDASESQDSDEVGLKQEVDQLEDQVKQKQTRVKELDNLIQGYRNKVQEHENAALSLQNEVALLENRIQEKQLAIERTRGEMEAVTLQIQALGTQIKIQQARITKREAALSDLFVKIQQEDTVSVFDAFMARPSLSEFFVHLDELAQLEGDLGEATRILKSEKKILEDKQTEQEKRRVALDEQKRLLQIQEQELEEERSSKISLVALTETKEEEFRKIVYELRQEQQSQASDIESLQERLKERLDSIDVALARGDILLSWPLPATRGISAHFHDPSYPFRKLFEHPGVDIPVPVGTPVRAAAGGYIAWNRTGKQYGNYVMVVHAGGIATVYAHLSRFAAKPDTYVERGDIIGYSGGKPGDAGAGLSTGPHLHFEVRQNGIPVNPENFLPSLD